MSVGSPQPGTEHLDPLVEAGPTLGEIHTPELPTGSRQLWGLCLKLHPYWPSSPSQPCLLLSWILLGAFPKEITCTCIAVSGPASGEPAQDAV